MFRIEVEPPNQTIVCSNESEDNKQNILTNFKKYPRTGKRGSPQAFAYILYGILENKEPTIEWLQDGSGFIIDDLNKFASETLPKYFSHTNVSSFQRQLNLYCFRKLKVHGERGAYSHPNFIRGQKELLVNVRRPRQRTVASSTVRKKSPLLKAGSYDGVEERAIYSSDETRAFKRCKLTGSPFADSSSDGDSVVGLNWLDGGDRIEEGSSGIVGGSYISRAGVACVADLDGASGHEIRCTCADDAAVAKFAAMAAAAARESIQAAAQIDTAAARAAASAVARIDHYGGSALQFLPIVPISFVAHDKQQKKAYEAAAKVAAAAVASVVEAHRSMPTCSIGDGGRILSATYQSSGAVRTIGTSMGVVSSGSEYCLPRNI